MIMQAVLVTKSRVAADRPGRSTTSTLSAVDSDLLTAEELRTLPDDQLAGLEQRSNLKGGAAREAVAVTKDVIPDNEDF